MNTIKITSYIFFLFLITICSTAFAQTASLTPEERAQRWDTWMKEQLALTPEQQGKVQEINLRYAKQNEQLKSTTADRRSKFQELKSTDKEKDNELKAILTKDQFKTYQEKKKDFQQKMLQNYRSK
jgi:hypothetical protein